MRRIHPVDQATPDDPEFIFDCPGCGYGHWIKTTGTSPRWTFNGDFERPTISPSIVSGPNDGLATRDSGARHGRCHSFVKDGNIQFLTDCWHELKGQTVPLPDMDS